MQKKGISGCRMLEKLPSSLHSLPPNFLLIVLNGLVGGLYMFFVDLFPMKIN
jgi:hypothetical protein